MRSNGEDAFGWAPKLTLEEEFVMNLKSSTPLVGILSACLASTTSATPLTGSGDHLSNTPVGEPPNMIREIFSENTPVDFDGGWSAPALPDWWGTFSATGPLPVSGTQNGTAVYDFSNLALGYLPQDTMFRFGDVDGVSGTETFTLNAWDLNGDPITDAWLEQPIGAWNSLGGTDPTLNQMPGWAFTAGEYFIDGSTVDNSPNPAVAFMLESNVPIAALTVNKINANFALAAPVPEPSTGLIALLCMSGLPIMRRRR